MLRVEAYWPLWLLLGVPAIAWLAHRQRTSLGQRRIRWAALLQSLVLVTVVLALMRPEWRRPHHEVATIYALDVSASMSPDFLATALRTLARDEVERPDAWRRYVVFADQPRVLTRAQMLNDVPLSEGTGVEAGVGAGVDDGNQAIDQSATDIEAALYRAVMAYPPQVERHLVLMTDGHQTQGDLWRVLPRLQAEGVRVYSVPAPAPRGQDAWIEDIDAPDLLRAREPFVLRVQVHARTKGTAQVELRQDARVLELQQTALEAGSNEVFFQLELPHAGAHALSARIVAVADNDTRNDSLSETLWVRSPVKLLHLSGGVARSGLPEVLRAQGLEVKALHGDDVTDGLPPLADIDAVLLDDLPADKLSPAAGAALQRFVRDDGGGLIFVAGENAYGKAAYGGSPVERLLPVKFEGKRKRKDLDLVLLIDRSYSMRGKKLELAKTAALSTLDLLEPEHRLAIIAFDARPHEVVALAEVGGKRRAEDLISSMTAGGQTHLYSALAHALRVLQNSAAKTRHVILLSDGVTAAPPSGEGVTGAEQMERVRRARQDMFDRWRRDNPGKPVPGMDELPPDPPPGSIEQLATTYRQEKITLSTVALGDKPNLPLLANLAQWTEGKAYVAARDSEIPGLFVSETHRLLGESLIEAPYRAQVKVQSAAVAGIDFAAAPALKGLAVSKPKGFAEVVLTGEKNLPLLVETRYGLGKTVAFMSDASNRWAVDWLNWPGYGKFWAQVIRDAARRDSGQGLHWQVLRHEDSLEVRLLASHQDGAPREDLRPQVRRADIPAPLSLRQTSPGVYVARAALPPPRTTPYTFDLQTGGGITPLEAARAGPRYLRFDRAEELRSRGAQRDVLERLSVLTGGIYAPAWESVHRPRGEGGWRGIPLSPWLIGLALLTYLAAVFVRRLP